MNPPPEKSTEEEWVDPYPRKNGALRWITTLLIILTIYFFSIGPAFRLMRLNKIPQRNYAMVYLPVFILCRAPLMNEFMGWYLDLWKPHL
jgi:hypothetical protein